MPSDKARLWNAAVAAVLMVLVFSSGVQECFHRSLLSSTAPGVPMDFPHYYIAGRLARQRPPGNILYYPPPGRKPHSYLDLRFDASTPYGSAHGGLPAGAVTRPFDAPPFAALLMEPFAILPWQNAYLALQLTCVALLGVSIYFALWLFQNRAPSAISAAVGATGALLFMPFNRSVGYGNIDVAMLFLWVLGVFLFRRGRIASSAFFLALGTAIKVTPAFAVPLFVLRRQWKWLICYLASSAVLLAFSVWRLGWQNHALWISQVAPGLAGGMKGFYNRSLVGLVYALAAPGSLLQDLPGSPGLFLLNKALSLACYSAFLFWCWRKTKNAGRLVFELALLPLVILSISPLSWPQHYVLALLPLLVLWSLMREEAASVSNVEMALLACCTFLFGSALPEFAARALGPPAELLLMAAWVAATFVLLCLGLRMHSDLSYQVAAFPTGTSAQFPAIAALTCGSMNSPEESASR